MSQSLLVYMMRRLHVVWSEQQRKWSPTMQQGKQYQKHLRLIVCLIMKFVWGWYTLRNLVLLPIFNSHTQLHYPCRGHNSAALPQTQYRYFNDIIDMPRAPDSQVDEIEIFKKIRKMWFCHEALLNGPPWQFSSRSSVPCTEGADMHWHAWMGVLHLDLPLFLKTIPSPFAQKTKTTQKASLGENLRLAYRFDPSVREGRHLLADENNLEDHLCPNL